jgi:hypothetical protein
MLEAIAMSPPIATLRIVPWMYGLVNGLHILGLAALFGAILTLDLRVLGLIRAESWRAAVALAIPVAATGLTAALVSGALLFAVRPSHYLANGPFLIKLGLILMAVLNAAVFHLLFLRSDSECAGWALRASACASLLIWMAAILAGRFIAFV